MRVRTGDDLMNRLQGPAKRFTIRWDNNWGGYRVSVPNLKGPLEVVSAADYDSVRAILKTAVDELDHWRENGSDVFRDELVDDFLVAAKEALGLS